ncbi:hypothetical protein B0H17DRAFT_1145630 [Mycena rosella]|uniref:Uncharacterized protein n=1 Tax=Mycena rosella TaxID=1033263 RepID=A0AAD7G1L8_MYCRO|nr:hypothetical protein B0H17DRAFT_1145630 [Mycena rosella]
MSGLPDVLKIPTGRKSSDSAHLPARVQPQSSLIKFQLPRNAIHCLADPTEYVSELHPTVITFNIAEIPVPPSVIVKALGCAILAAPKPSPSCLSIRRRTVKKAITIHSGWLHLVVNGACTRRESLWRTAVDQVQETLEKSTTSEAIAGRANAALKAAAHHTRRHS